MKLTFIPILLFLLSVCACRSKEENHLSAKEMQQILFDIHLAEAYSMVLQPDSLHKTTERNMDSLATYYVTIFKHYHITSTEFEQSMDWYKKHPEELDSVYTRMIPEMSKLEKERTN